MAYEPTDWKNREVERPRTFTLQENEDGTITLIPAEGKVTEPGTPIMAVNMNKIENQLVVLDEAVDNMFSLTKSDGSLKPLTDGENVDEALKSGLYFGGTGLGTLGTLPTTAGAYIIQVLDLGDNPYSPGTVVQIAYQTTKTLGGAKGTYQRTFANSSQTWQPWVSIIDTNEISRGISPTPMGLDAIAPFRMADGLGSGSIGVGKTGNIAVLFFTVQNNSQLSTGAQYQLCSSLPAGYRTMRGTVVGQAFCFVSSVARVIPVTVAEGGTVIMQAPPVTIPTNTNISGHIAFYCG